MKLVNQDGKSGDGTSLIKGGTPKGIDVMALLAKINQEEYEKLSEAIQTEYKQQDDGTYMLDVTSVEGFALENVTGLKTSLSKTLTREKEAVKKLKEFEGIDPEKAKAALQKMDELANGKLDDKSKAKIEAAINQFKEEATKEIEQAKEETKKWKNSAISAAKNTAINDALLKHKANENLRYYLEKVIKSELQDDGTIKLTVHDNDENIKYSNKSGSMELMTVEEHVSELKNIDSFAPFFEGSGATGSGAKTDGSGIKTGMKNPFAKETFNLTEQSKLMKTNPKLAEQLKTQAGVS